MITNRIFILLLSVICAIPIYANTLIITRGPVCSGMGNYLSNAIKSVDDSYQTFSQNDLFNVVYYQVFNELFPDQMSIISKAIEQENISYAITNYYVYFKDTAYEQQKQQALEAIIHIRKALNNPFGEQIHTNIITTTKHLVMAELAYHAACKHNVVLEGGTLVNFDDEFSLLKNSFDTVVETLTYCPPTDMIEQWQQKETQAINEKKSFKRRHIKQVLKSFFNNFIPTDNEENAVIILTRDEFNAIINQATDYILTTPEDEIGENSIFTRTEFTLEELMALKESLYEQYNFYTVDYIALSPRLSYDILLNCTEDCLNFAQRIANGEF